MRELTQNIHWPRAGLVVLAMAALLASCAIVGRLRLPLGPGATVIYCPLCGGTRAVHAFWHGQFIEAFGYNPLLFLSAPLVGYFLLGLVAIFVSGYYLPGFRNPFTWPRNWAIGFGLLALSYTVLRNVPTWPWTWLAP